MEHLRFLDQTADLGLALPGSYDPALVTLSVLIASLAAYAALGIAPRISAAEGAAAGRSWLAAGAVAMGIARISNLIQTSRPSGGLQRLYS